ncbi:MAG TPA: BtpA/SgcQ family protein [bacterium]|nr:BtpA/SgcQ family protein [bacterium]
MEFRTWLERHKTVVGMIHLAALPGAPGHSLTVPEIVETAVREARMYKDAGFPAVLIENMNDVPYTRTVGPEIPAVMAVIGDRIRALDLFCGVQVLAGCNREAMAVAIAANLDFIRVEGFVFGHVADEGYIDACAGELLRYRRAVNGSGILIFADIKKKHCAHAVTADVSLRETAEAAAMFEADGVVVTGSRTGLPADPDDLAALSDLPLIRAVGSGLTTENIAAFVPLADVFIVGSSLKSGGSWRNAPEMSRLRHFYETFSVICASL